MSENKKSSGESFAGNVMKYSVATYLGFAITGLALIVKGLLPAEVLGAPVTFMTYTATIMNIGILGLDQALLRFYHEPPAGAEPRQLFAACTRISAAFMMLLGVAGSVFFAQPLAAAFGLGSAGPGIVPLLFLNAALYMLVRYLNVLLRLENDLRAYTAETLWMQGCYNLFYLLPGFFTSNVFVLAVAAILSFGVVAIAFGYKYRAAVFAPLPGAQLGGIARQTVPYGVALAPAQILFSLSSGICLSFVGNASGENAQGLFAFGYSLAQLVTAIQAGFSTYWFHHGIHIVHIQAASGNIRRHQKAQAPLAEGIHHALPHHLGHIPMKAIHRITAGRQTVHHVIHHLFGIGEHQPHFNLSGVKQPAEYLNPGGKHHFVINLFNGRHRQRRPFNGNLDGLLHEPAHQTVDFRRHGSGKKQGLLRFRHGLRNAFDVFQKTHIQHLVRLIQNQHAESVQP